jgi:hypothetical protein
MPEQETIQTAHEQARKGKAPSAQAVTRGKAQASLSTSKEPAQDLQETIASGRRSGG